MSTEIIELDEIESTNEFCKKLNLDDAIVIAKKQSGGKGTKGRSFYSEEGGLYLSKAKKYESFDYSKTFSIMINSCVAVCRTVEHFGLKPKIKWANDVLVGGKKICGTLIENRLCSGGNCTSIVGIGLNVNNALSEEIKDIATSMSEQTGKKLNLKKVQNMLIKNLESDYTVEDYKAYIDWFGQEVTLESNGETFTAVAYDVDEAGNLVCGVNGQIKKISSAEMSLRLKCKSI